MKPILKFAVICLFAVAPLLRADTLPPDDQYFNIYSLILKGDRLMEKGKTDAARTNYLDAAAELKRFQEDFPLWNKPVVKYRLNYLESKLAPPEPGTPAATPRVPMHASSATGGGDMTGKPGDDGKPVDMKLKWQTGKRYNQQMDMTMDMDVAVPGQSQNVRQKMTLGAGYSISVLKDREGGGKELEMQLKGIAMNVDVGGRSVISYDSKNPPTDPTANPLAGVMQKLSGMDLKMLTDANGKVESIEGFNEFIDSMNGPGGAGGADAVKGMFSQDTFKQMASLQGLPDHPVKIGDTWPVKNEIALPSLGTMVMDMTYTFTGWEQRDDHKCAVLSFNGNIYTKTGENGTTLATVSIDDGKTSGELLFDPAQVMAVETSAIQSFSMNMSAQGQSMSTKLTQDINMKLAGVTEIPQ